MKIGDLIKITDGDTEVFILQESISSYCPHWDDDCCYLNCEECEYEECREEEVHEWEKYHGSAKGVPIAMADLKVTKISAKFRPIYTGIRKKKENHCFLMIYY